MEKIKKGILGGFLASVHCTSVIRLTFQHKLSQNCSELIFLSFFTHLRSSSSSLYQGRGEVGMTDFVTKVLLSDSRCSKPEYWCCKPQDHSLEGEDFLVNYGKQTNENFEINTRLVISSQLRSCATYQLSFPERSQTLWEWECTKKLNRVKILHLKLCSFFKFKFTTRPHVIVLWCDVNLCYYLWLY